MENSDFLSYFNKETRLFVLEASVTMEDRMSWLLGVLLQIDPEQSKSFGSKSESLSFNQKVGLVQDIHGENELDRSKLQLLMEIRNKFAHVLKIRSFRALFDFSNDTAAIEKRLNKIYPSEKASESDFENFYKAKFLRLVLEISTSIAMSAIKAAAISAKSETQKESREALLEELKEELSKLEGGDVAMNRAIEKVRKKF